jgi:hypothetical protein
MGCLKIWQMVKNQKWYSVEFKYKDAGNSMQAYYFKNLLRGVKKQRDESPQASSLCAENWKRIKPY